MINYLSIFSKHNIATSLSKSDNLEFLHICKKESPLEELSLLLFVDEFEELFKSTLSNVSSIELLSIFIEEMDYVDDY